MSWTTEYQVLLSGDLKNGTVVRVTDIPGEVRRIDIRKLVNGHFTKGGVNVDRNEFVIAATAREDYKQSARGRKFIVNLNDAGVELETFTTRDGVGNYRRIQLNKEEHGKLQENMNVVLGRFDAQ